jgi:hypothetical protein
MIRFRKTVPEDLLKISDWIAQDEGHKGIDPSFFTASGKGISCYAIEDEQGAVIFVRQEALGQLTQLHTQFPADRKRVARALKEAYPLVANDARERGFKVVRFESCSLALIRFMLSFGFKAALIAEL